MLRTERYICMKCGKQFTKMVGGVVPSLEEWELALRPVCAKCKLNMAVDILNLRKYQGGIFVIQTNTIKAAGVSEKDIRQLETAWDAFQSAKNHTPHQTLHIACTGIYNAGKSTLLNALAGKEIFPTGDVPTTKKVAQAEFDGAVYIDTPGLNAAEEDDQETQAAYETADFILFVSSAQNGGISESEAAWLQRLKARYSSLQQRLIFVLTHCTQVEEEQLPAIREQVSGDLGKALGFAPEQIFCVDSVTYQDGEAAKEPLLVESSGIQTLRGHIAGKIAEADKLLNQAWQSELAQKQKDVQQQISTIHAMVKEKQDKAGNEQKQKLAALDKTWTAFEADLKETMPYEKIGPICSHGISTTSLSGDSRKEKSVGAAKSAARSALSSFYDSTLPRAVEREVKRCLENAEKYCNVGLDSAYHNACEAVNKCFMQGVLAFQKLGISGSGISEIEITPSVPSGLMDSLGWTLKEGTRYRSVSAYVDDADVLQDLDIVPRLFDPYHTVTKYYFYISGISFKMKCDVEEIIKKNSKRANDKLNGVWQEFRKELLSEIKKRKTALKKQVDSYKATLSQSATSSSTQSALSYLESLKREVSQ